MVYRYKYMTRIYRTGEDFNSRRDTLRRLKPTLATFRHQVVRSVGVGAIELPYGIDIVCRYENNKISVCTGLLKAEFRH